jgi:hypothetical protein
MDPASIMRPASIMGTGASPGAGGTMRPADLMRAGASGLRRGRVMIVGRLLTAGGE